MSNKFIATEEDLKKLIGENVKEDGHTRNSDTTPSNVHTNIDNQTPETIPSHTEEENKKLSEEEEKEEKDFEEIRKNLYKLSEKATNILSKFENVATETQHPHAYDTLTKLIKSVIDCQQALSKMHIDKNNIKKTKAQKTTPQKIVNNNLICTTTAELDKILKKSKDSK